MFALIIDYIILFFSRSVKDEHDTIRLVFSILRKNIVIFLIFFKKVLDKTYFLCYNSKAQYGRLAQLGEHLPYKQRVTGSSPVLSTKEVHLPTYRDGLVAQLVRALACHARGRGFEPHPSRHPICLCSSVGRAGD